MDFELTLSTNPRFSSRFSASAPDPVVSILEALKRTVSDLGCPECCSGFPLIFVKESADFGGSGTIIGNGFKLERLTRLDDDLVLAEGVNGGVINVGRIRPGHTVFAEELVRPARVALMVGRKEVMDKFFAAEPGAKSPAENLAENPQLKEMLASFDAIGFAQFPLVARTNDPLIS